MTELTPTQPPSALSLRPRRGHAYRSLARWALAGIAPLLLSCSGGRHKLQREIDEAWQWDHGSEASLVLAALAGKEALVTASAAVGLTNEGLVGRKLPDGKLWTYTGTVDVLPTIAGSSVLFTGNGRLVLLDLATGRKKFDVDVQQRRLEGASTDGRHYVLLLVDKDNARPDQVRVVDPSGATLFQAATTARLGTPAAVEGIGLLPYSGQYVFGFELATGKPIGRLLYRDALHTVVARPGGILLLGAGASLLNADLASQPDSRSLQLKTPSFPGDPHWPPDGSEPRPARAQPVSLYAYPQRSAGKLTFSDRTYAVAYFDIIAGFDDAKSRLRWTRALPHTLVGGASGPGGPILCLENGTIFRVAWKNGTLAPFGSLETKVKACTVSAPRSEIDGDAPGSLFDQVVTTLSQTGPNMVAMQLVLLKAIAKRDEVETTRALLAITQDPLVSSELAREAGRLLALQEAGGDIMVQALLKTSPSSTRDVTEPDPPKVTEPTSSGSPPTDLNSSDSDPSASDSSDSDPSASDSSDSDSSASDPSGSDLNRRRAQRPPPVSQLSLALRKLKPEGAAGALAPYLADPSLSAREVERVMETVAALGSQEQNEEVASFLRHYKNTGGEAALLHALVLAAEFVLEHSEEAERAEWIAELNDSLTHPELRARLQRIMPKYSPQNPDSEKPADRKSGRPIQKR